MPKRREWAAMSIIICPECAKRITDNVDKCPNCGCLKNEFVTLMNRDEKDYIVLLLANTGSDLMVNIGTTYSCVKYMKQMHVHWDHN